MRTLLLALGAALLAGCSSESDPLTAAQDAISRGDNAEAADVLGDHVATLDPSSDEYREATVLYCQALAESEPEKSKTVFLALAEQQPENVTPKDFRFVTSYLQTYGHYLEAIDVMDAGLKRWPGDPTMTQVKDVVLAAVRDASDEAALDKLKGLGYL